ncbi:hypothetical protein KY334_00195 [Candidatus Woesearchaeota archaeon]|nr:hypothetical protein [Candidatus Woesearchaeota archaeon]
MNCPVKINTNLEGITQMFDNGVFIDTCVLGSTYVSGCSSTRSSINDSIRSLKYYLKQIDNGVKFNIIPGVEFEFFEKGNINRFQEDSSDVSNKFKRKYNAIPDHDFSRKVGELKNLMKSFHEKLRDRDMFVNLEDDNTYKQLYDEFIQIKEPLKLSDVDYELLISATTQKYNKGYSVILSHDNSIMHGWSFIKHNKNIGRTYGYYIRKSDQRFQERYPSSLETIANHIVKLSE